MAMDVLIYSKAQWMQLDLLPITSKPLDGKQECLRTTLCSLMKLG